MGLGLDEISLAGPRVTEAKAALSRLNAGDCRELLSEACRCQDADAVEEVLAGFSPVAIATPLDEGLIRLGSESSSRAEVIRELALLLETSGRSDCGDAVEEALWQREMIHSTAIGFGVAVPHCRSPHVRQASLALVRTLEPVEWPSLDDQPVSLAILLALPETAAETEHLKLLATLSRQLMHEEFRATLLEVTRPAETVALLRQHLSPG